MPPSCSPVFQYKYSHFSVFCMHFQYFTKSSIYYDVCTEFPQFSVFLKFYQYLWSEFSKNTDKSVYLEALYYLNSMHIKHCNCTVNYGETSKCRNFNSKVCIKIPLQEMSRAGPYIGAGQAMA